MLILGTPSLFDNGLDRVAGQQILNGDSPSRLQSNVLYANYPLELEIAIDPLVWINGLKANKLPQILVFFWKELTLGKLY